MNVIKETLRHCHVGCYKYVKRILTYLKLTPAIRVLVATYTGSNGHLNSVNYINKIVELTSVMQYSTLSPLQYRKVNTVQNVKKILTFCINKIKPSTIMEKGLECNDFYNNYCV